MESSRTKEDKGISGSQSRPERIGVEELSRSEVFPEYQDFWKLTHRLKGALDIWFDFHNVDGNGTEFIHWRCDEYFGQFYTAEDVKVWDETGGHQDFELIGMAAVLKHEIISFEELCEWMEYYEKHLLRFDQERRKPPTYGSVTPVWYEWYDAWKLFRERYEKAKIKAEAYHG